MRTIALVLGLLATVTSFLGSWIPSLWGDEMASVLSSQRSFASLFSMLGSVDAVHGTYYVLLHFWVDVFGASPFSVRFPSAIAVGIMVAGVVMLTTRLTTVRTGIYAGVIALALPRVVEMGQEARGYALSAACIVWLTFLLVHILQNDDSSRRLWIVYAIGVAVCGYVFLFSLLILISHTAIVFAHRNRSIRARWLRATGFGLVLAGPVIGFGIGQRGQVAFLANRDAANPRIFIVYQWFGNDQFAVLAWVAVISAIVLGIVGWRRRRGHILRGQPGASTSTSTSTSAIPNIVLLSATWSIGSMALLIIANAIHPIYSSRYLSFAAPGAAILIASVLARIGSGRRSRWIGTVVLVVLVATSVPSYLADRTPYAKNNSDWAEVSAVIKANSTPGDAIMFDESTRPSRAPRLAMRGYPDSYVGLKDVTLDEPWFTTTNWHDSVSPLADVLARLDGVDRVWMVEYKTPGGAANTANLSLLAEQGYSIVRSWPLHSSEVLELTR